MGQLYRKLANHILAKSGKRTEFLDKIRDAEKRYSDDHEKELSINQGVVKIYNDHEELIYFLAQGKADQVNIIRKMTLKERLKFQQLKIKEIEKGRSNTPSGNASDDD